MNETALYAKIGKLTIEAEAQAAKLAVVLLRFAEVISGKADQKRFLVNLTDQDLQWAAEGQTPAAPAMINGAPVCVVGVEPPIVGEMSAELGRAYARIAQLQEQLEKSTAPAPAVTG